MKKKKLLYIVCGSAIALVFVILLSVSSAKPGDTRTVAMVNGVAISETNDASAIIMKTLLDQFDKRGSCKPPTPQRLTACGRDVLSANHPTARRGRA